MKIGMHVSKWIKIANPPEARAGLAELPKGDQSRLRLTAMLRTYRHWQPLVALAIVIVTIFALQRAAFLLAKPAAACIIMVWIFCTEVLFFLTRSYFFSQELKLMFPGRCPQCGYDLRGTPDRCPECGTVRRGN